MVYVVRTEKNNECALVSMIETSCACYMLTLLFLFGNLGLISHAYKMWVELQLQISVCSLYLSLSDMKQWSGPRFIPEFVPTSHLSILVLLREWISSRFYFNWFGEESRPIELNLHNRHSLADVQISGGTDTIAVWRNPGNMSMATVVVLVKRLTYVCWKISLVWMRTCWKISVVWIRTCCRS